jgi:soluble cytochrome b562
MTRFWIAASLMVSLLAVSASAYQDKDKDKKDDEDDKEIKAAQKDVLDLTKDVTGGKADKDIAEKAGKIKKKYEELNTVMHIFKPKAKGGIGLGKNGEGIELKIISLGKRKLAGPALTKEKDELIKMADINVAMAAVAKHYAPSKPKGGKGKKDWDGHADDMKKAAEELRKAAKAGNADDVKKAANNLNNSCNNCHTDFRDS